jgi:two-component system copper resistance phosphate regulon response regulator CusR
MTRILIAEDEPRIAAFLSQGLSSNGYAVTVATDGRTALHLARSGEADLMVLDLGLPGLDGAAVLAELRAARSALPVIVLTARTSLQDTVDILDAGADDFMPKPFRIDELLARIRLRLQPDRAAESTVLRHRELALDLRTRRVTVAGRLAELTAREFALAETLLRHPGQVLSREQLLNLVWGYDYDPGSNIVDVYIRHLRRKLGRHHIATVRGAGYRLE